MTDTATQQGAARQEPPNPDVKDDEVEVRPNPRNAALEAMAERQEEMRRQELNDALDGDPGMRHQQNAIDAEIDQANREAGIVHEETDGAASRQPMHEPEADQQDLPAQYQDDPMADFIEMQNGQPMVKAKVNGEDRLIPLADAKRQIQIGTAAEMRMQAAAESEKQIREREQRLAAGEAALSARMKSTQQPQAPSTPAQPALTNEEIEREATEIFETAFSGTEEDAAKKLALMLGKIRDSAARPAPTQQVDANLIARQAASLAMGSLTAQSRKKDVAKGFQTFKDNYPEIISDPQLFKMADDMTENIEREHPNWDVAQIMDEAGKRTRKWVKGLRGETDDTGDAPPRQPVGDGTTISDSASQARHDRKAGLVRMPSPAAAATYQEQPETAGSEQSPQDAFLEIKKARGQPT